MSVIMTMRLNGDPAKLAEVAKANRDGLHAILDRAKAAGVIAHRFYGSDDGRIMVADEWPDEQSFMGFFESTREQIQGLMADVGVQGEPEITFWRKLDTGDEVGWGA